LRGKLEQFDVEYRKKRHAEDEFKKDSLEDI